MIKLSLTISFVLSLVICYGQNHLDKDTSHFKNAPLYILQLPLSAPITASNIIIEPKDIDSIIVLKNDSSIREYVSSAINGVVIFKTKKTIHILTSRQLLAQYKINDVNMPVFIDSAIAFKPMDVIFQPEVVKSVEIAIESGTGMKYISIITKFPVHRSKSDEIMIK